MYAKRGNLVDMDASGTKASTKHLESQRSFKVTHFVNFLPRSRICMICHCSVVMMWYRISDFGAEYHYQYSDLLTLTYLSGCVISGSTDDFCSKSRIMLQLFVCVIVVDILTGAYESDQAVYLR